MSLVLAIDTSTPAVTAGVVADGHVLAERVTVDARAHAERITPNVLGALADAFRYQESGRHVGKIAIEI